MPGSHVSTQSGCGVAVSLPRQNLMAPGLDFNAPSSGQYAHLLQNVLKESFRSCHRSNVEKEIIDLLLGKKTLQHGVKPATRFDASSGAPREAADVVRRVKLCEKKSTIVSVDGGCQNCATQQTPQWRYVHREKFCNACYMRIKRWVQCNLEGIKLPSRARGELPKHKDDQYASLACDIINRALTAMKSE